MNKDDYFKETFDNSKPEQEPKNVVYRFAREKAADHPKPVIRNLKIVEPTEELLVKLAIYDERQSEFQKNKDKIKWDFQIISGEAEVNGVIFDVYIVLPKKTRIFTDEVLKNSDLTEEEKKEYQSRRESKKIEKRVMRNLIHLSRVDEDILKTIQMERRPYIVFKTSREYDINYASKKWVDGYVQRGGRGDKNINFINTSHIPIVHEFGHLFDYALGITDETWDRSNPNPRWVELSKKYSKALKRTTTCGTTLSGYSSKEYEEKVGEFFADLFEAYYMGDKAKEGTYMIEYLDEDALLELQSEMANARARKLLDKSYNDYIFLRGDIEEAVEAFGDYDQELYFLGQEFLQTYNDYIFNNYENGVHFNTIKYLEVLPILKQFHALSREYLDNPVEENKNRIIEHVKTQKPIIKNDNIPTKSNFNTYEEMIELFEQLKNQFIEQQDEETATLITNFIETLKGYTDEEREAIKREDIDELIRLCTEKIKSKTKDNSFSIENIPERTTTDIRNCINRIKDRIKFIIKSQKDTEELVNIENDEKVSEKNKREATRKLFWLKGLLKIKGPSLPPEALEEAQREIEIINQQIDLMSIDGLTNIELKTILVSENDLFNKIKNYFKKPDIISRICFNLSKLIISVKEIIKKYPDRKDLIDYVFMAERLKELLSNEELFKNRRGINFLIKECLLQCDEEIKDQLTKPPMLIGTRTYKLQNFFDRLEYSITIDTSEQRKIS